MKANTVTYLVVSVLAGTALAAPKEDKAVKNGTANAVPTGVAVNGDAFPDLTKRNQKTNVAKLEQENEKLKKELKKQQNVNEVNKREEVGGQGQAGGNQDQQKDNATQKSATAQESKDISKRSSTVPPAASGTPAPGTQKRDVLEPRSQRNKSNRAGGPRPRDLSPRGETQQKDPNSDKKSIKDQNSQ
ncbi:hypothetical protein CDD80_5219 [Ophiocordyceps camponoti-rufipedis]|uniref:Uncharacterized protein n=1 Tax=Ophiocordyceps camponoti-rufipedis TaxID=2004952 RepID=A0A2C5YV60_9HYPO|nr:hypothetical protein CDD80_5219 [Ophiocordyceps camponoti-rufipedis]